MLIEKISTREMSEAQWVASRRGSIGGSDAATVLGLNPWSSPYALWAEKTGLVEPEDISQKEPVRLGHVLEPYVAQRFTEITGKRVRRENFILKNKLYPWAHANVDRMVIGEKAGLECKTTSELNLKMFKNGEYPANYYCQCVHYLAVTGYERWYLAVLIGNKEVRIFEIERDEEEIAALMEAERRFWGHVEARTPPPVDGLKATGETLAALYTDEGGRVDLTPVCADIREYLTLKAEIAKLEGQLDACANSIKAFMGTASKGDYEDFRVDWSQRSRRTFDVKAFQKENPDVDLAPFYRVSTFRQFSVKG